MAAVSPAFALRRPIVCGGRPGGGEPPARGAVIGVSIHQGANLMPRGDKSAYTTKQKRQAAHIEESYESRGVPDEEAERRAWATVNKAVSYTHLRAHETRHDL